MKTTALRVGISASFSLFFAGAANATLLVGWHDFDGNPSNPGTGSTASENPDYAAAGFSGNVNKGGQYSVDTGGSSDGIYGNSSIPVSGIAGGDGYARITNASSLTFSLTNSTPDAVQLDKLFFDAAVGNTSGSVVSVSYKIGAGSPASLDNTAPTPLAQALTAGAYLDFSDFSFNLLSIPLFNAGQTISFIFTSSNSARIDNVAITGLSAIPEPASLIALGCVLGSGLMIRRRQQLPAA